MALTRARLAQVNTTLASLQDSITLINRGADTANIDVGFIFNRDGGSSSNVAIFWDETNDIVVTAFTDSTAAANSNVNVTGYTNLKADKFYGNIGGGTAQANVYITGSLLPSANVTYDLGSETRRFKTLWLANNTIDLGGETISVGSGGTWNFSSNGTVISMGHSVPFNPAAINSTLGEFATLTTTGLTILANTSGNVVVASTAQSTGATSGALVVKGGLGVEKDLWVAGNLNVAGTSTTLNTTTLDVSDLNITLAKNAPTAFAADGAGITIEGAGATLLYNNSSDSLDVNKLLRGSGVYFTSANITTGNIVTVNTSTINATTGNVTNLSGATVNVQATTSTVLNATTANIGTTLVAGGNIVAASGTESVSSTSGAAVVVGGIGVSGNVFASKVYTGSGLFWSGNGISALAAAGTTAGTSPPGSAKYGDLWYNTSNDVVYQYLSDGTSNYWIDISSQTIAANTSNVINGNLTVSGELFLTGTAWTSYTPTWTTSGTAPSIGNGVLTGKYKQIGKTVFVRVRLQIGSTTTTGTGHWRISLPVTAADVTGVIMPATYLDNGVNWHIGLVNCEYDGDTSYVVPLLGTAPSGAVSATAPFTWNVGDNLAFNGSYEAA